MLPCGMHKVRIFTGTDPGAKGAHAVMSVVDAPDSPEHGSIIDCVTFDLPTRERDGGGTELDVPKFYGMHSAAETHVSAFDVHDLDNPSIDGLYTVTGSDHLVERPNVGGAMGRGTASLVTQAINAGAVHATLDALGSPGQTLGWTSSSAHGWRCELGGIPKGDELAAAVNVLAHIKPHESDLLETTDRCVAALIAETARRRWLGTACTPKTTGTAKAAKARKSNARKEAIARACAPLTVAKAKTKIVVSGVECVVHEDSEAGQSGANSDLWCTPKLRCCEAKLLHWTHITKPDPPHHSLWLGPHKALVSCFDDANITIERKPSTSKLWTIAPRGGKVEPMFVDWAIDHGLLTLIPGDKKVRYTPTQRGLVQCLLLKTAVVP
jgi:hypothetical protein